MRLQTLVAGVCAAAFIPTIALAQQTCEQRQNDRVAGTAIGAGVGAVAGSVVAGRGDRTEGAVIGGIAGALIGNQVSKGQRGCANAYGFYDNSGAWHANAVAAKDASGYYDRAGTWVDGAPRGRYDSDGGWVQVNTEASAAGYYDANHLWVPAAADGYYTQDGRWVAAAAPGRYDRSGRWVPGPTTGRYTAEGAWMAGQATGHRDAKGVWVADPQPGHYEDGRWIRGEAFGYYDARGRWISTGASAQRTSYSPQGGQRIDDREAELAQRIHRNVDTGRMSGAEGARATRTLAAIQRDERSLRGRQGVLSPRSETTLNDRLDALSTMIRGDGRDQPDQRYGAR